MKKLKRSHIVLLVILLSLAAAALWYTAPRTADTLYPEFDWASVTQVSGSWTRYEANTENPAAVPVHFDGTVTALSIDSETGQAILHLLRDVKYRRSLLDLLSANGTQTHPIQPGDLKISADFAEENGGRSLSVEFWFDRIFLDLPGEDQLICFTSDHDALARELLAILQPLTTEERTER